MPIFHDSTATETKGTTMRKLTLMALSLFVVAAIASIVVGPFAYADDNEFLKIRGDASAADAADGEEQSLFGDAAEELSPRSGAMDPNLIRRLRHEFEESQDRARQEIRRIQQRLLQLERNLADRDRQMEQMIRRRALELSWKQKEEDPFDSALDEDEVQIDKHPSSASAFTNPLAARKTQTTRDPERSRNVERQLLERRIQSLDERLHSLEMDKSDLEAKGNILTHGVRSGELSPVTIRSLAADEFSITDIPDAKLPEQALEAFKTKLNLLKAQIERSKTQLEEYRVQLKRIISESRQTSAAGLSSSASVPRGQTDPTTEAETARIAADRLVPLQIELQTAMVGLGAAHPKVKALEKQILLIQQFIEDRRSATDKKKAEDPGLDLDPFGEHSILIPVK